MADIAVLDLALFIGATFAAALVAGMAGFAFGLSRQRSGCMCSRPCRPPR
jgi:hypothetical protein